MAPTTTPTALISSIYEAFTKRDIAFIVSQVAPQAIWRQSPTLPWGGDYRGPEGAAEFFRKLDATMETQSFVAQEDIEVGNEVHSFGSYGAKSRQTGRSATADWMFRWRVEGGKVTSWVAYIDSAALLAALQ